MDARNRSHGELTWLVLLLVALGLAGCFSERATGVVAGACGTSLDPAQYGSTILAIQNYAFHPNSVHVKVGGKVTWLDCEAAGAQSHTSTADGGAWSSPLLDPGSTFTVTFPTTGTYGFHCQPHPSMTGQVIVDP